MTSFATLSAQLKLNISGFSKSLKDAAKGVDKFNNNLKGSINSATNAVNGLTKATKKSGVEFKDVARIVQGIIISKVFYSGLQSIRDTTSAVWEFSSALEYAKIAYSNLFGDTSLAQEFVNVLEDFAATTPFSFKESEDAAKRLLAYGVKYENVMYIMQGIMSAAAMQGDPAKVASISRAIGQIYTKGRLMGDEMKQLTEAGIPAWEILQEKIGLTADQVGRIGGAGIDATTAINALIDGMTERYGDVVTASSRTMTGIISNIQDNATMLAADMFTPVYDQIKSIANALGELLFALRDIQATSGTGGVFEYLVPKELQASLRLFIANLMALRQAIVNLVVAASGLLNPALQALIGIFNMFAPLISTILNYVAGITTMITSNAQAMQVLATILAVCASMWVVYKARAVAAAVVTGIISGMSKALTGLAAMLNFIAAHPVWSILIAIVGIVAGLSVGFDKLGNSVKKLFTTLTTLNGYDPDKMLLPSQKERANDLDKFNKKLSGTSDAMDDLADSTGKATKAAKGLLSFDEVFKINTPDEGANNDPALPNLDLSGLDFDIDSNAFIPEVPDFTGFANNWFNDLSEALKKKLAGAGLGAVLGGILGGILGGGIGAKLGAVAGAIAGFFWEDLANAMGVTDVGKVAIPIATMLGGIIGAVIGGPGGAILGTAIGLLVGWIIESISQGFQTGDWSGASTLLGTVLGGLIGLAAGGPAGAGIGAAIGTLVGWILSLFTKRLQEGNITGAGMAFGGVVGGAIGFVAGGPAGALAGAAIGTLVGWIIESLAKALKEAGNFSTLVSAFKLWGDDIGSAFIEGLLGDGGIFGWSTTLFETAVGFFDDAKKAFEEQDWGSLGANILLGILYGIGGALTFIFEPIARLFDAIWEAICKVFGIESPAKEMKPIGENILLGIVEGFIGGISYFLQTIADFASEVLRRFNESFTKVKGDLSTWTNNIWSFMSTWIGNAWTKAVEWCVKAKTVLSEWLSTTASKVLSSITTAFINIKTTASSWLSTIWTSVSSWLSNIKLKAVSWVGTSASTIASSLGTAFRTIKTTASNWLNNLWTSLSKWLQKVKDKVSDWVKNTANGISDTFKGIGDWVGGVVNKAADKFNSASSTGHATGGVFNREHYAKFAEGNKAEAIIPLEEDTAMQPFVDAVANGLTASLAPLFASMPSMQQQPAQQLQPLYVGTLIADDRSLKELERKMNVIRIQEDKRR